MKALLVVVILNAFLLLFTGFAAAQSSMTCTCSGKTYKGTCASGQTATSCNCSSKTVTCKKKR